MSCKGSTTKPQKAVVKKAVSRLRARGKMPIRERIAHVLDRDSPFLEISPLAAWRSSYDIGSGFVVGIGVIEGVECVILGHDPSVRAGAFNPFNGKKLMRGLEIARENRMPYVQFVESAGADLRGQGGGDGGDPNKVAEAAIQRDPRSLCRIRPTVLRNIRTVKNAYTHCVGRVWCCHRRWCLSAWHE